jgi:hypothetical protein
MNWLLYIGGALVIFLSIFLALGQGMVKDWGYYFYVYVVTVPFWAVWAWLMWKFVAKH